jgi:hypothetical protein
MRKNVWRIDGTGADTFVTVGNFESFDHQKYAPVSCQSLD